MKETGIVRRVDDLGRIVIPKEVRRQLRIHDGDPMELFIADGGVIFKPYSPLNTDHIITPAVRAIQRKGLKCAAYDCWDQIAGNNTSDFPERVPDQWRENRDPFSTGELSIYPIIVTGEILGFVAVKDDSHKDYISGVVGLLKANLEDN